MFLEILKLNGQYFRINMNRAEAADTNDIDTITGFSGSVLAFYKVEKRILGEGAFGTVRCCHDRKSNESYAVKSIRKAKLLDSHREDGAKCLRGEIDVLLSVSHPNVVHVIDIFEDNRFLHIVTDLCTGGDLFEAILAKSKAKHTAGAYDEGQASSIVRKILSAVEYCHNELDLVHRDLKPEQILLRGPKKGEGEPVVCDFGLAAILPSPDSRLSSDVGTPLFIAPEILTLKPSYSKACDMWSLGVITYIMLSGTYPFFGDSEIALYEHIKSGQFNFPEKHWKGISTEAKEFIQSLLNVDPELRPTASMALEQNAWFVKAHADPVDVANATLLAVPERLGRASAMPKLKRRAMSILSRRMTGSQILALASHFDAIDVDNSGLISARELKDVLVRYCPEAPDIASEVETLIELFDHDGNHQLDRQEFFAATLSRSIFIQEENIQYAFACFDSDSTGSITLSNLIEIFGSEEHAREVLNDVDLDGDKKISYSEFRLMMIAKEKQTKTARRVSGPKLHHTTRVENISVGENTDKVRGEDQEGKGIVQSESTFEVKQLTAANTYADKNGTDDYQFQPSPPKGLPATRSSSGGRAAKVRAKPQKEQTSEEQESQPQQAAVAAAGPALHVAATAGAVVAEFRNSEEDNTAMSLSTFVKRHGGQGEV